MWPELESMFDMEGMKSDAAKASKDAKAAFGEAIFDHMLPLMNGQDVYIESNTGGRWVGVLRVLDGKVEVSTDKGNLDAAAWVALCAGQQSVAAPRDLIKLATNGMSLRQALQAMGGKTSWDRDNYATEEIFTKGLGSSSVQRSKVLPLDEFAKVLLEPIPRTVECMRPAPQIFLPVGSAHRPEIDFRRRQSADWAGCGDG